MKPAVGIDIRMIRNTGIGTYLRGILGPMLDQGGPEDFEPVLFGPSLILMGMGLQHLEFLCILAVPEIRSETIVFTRTVMTLTITEYMPL